MANPTDRIYTDDPLIKYATTAIKAERTKQQIDGVLAEYQVKDVWWHFDIPRESWVRFAIEEEVNGHVVKVGVRVDCPTIWERAKPRGRTPESRIESINWDVSMRAMYHFIYTHLNAAYAMRSGKIVAFLGYIAGVDNKQLKDILLPKLNEYAALELEYTGDKNINPIIDTEVVEHKTDVEEEKHDEKKG
jgi:hypothetical protein